ncbi:MAG: MBL fold metallo-hydrolase [Candidatus Thorarchaeota archaeon]|jgi:glyoxylase-like metal-dependent hydrolase (beta-lactamase superfamily II)
MTHVGVPLELDSSTSIIDIGYFDAAGTCSIYLIKGERTCIIDTGTAAEVPTLCKGLKAAKAYPPDIIALTHSHFDHCQGVPMLRELAANEGKEIEVMASEAGVGLLADQSFNRVFDKKGRYEDIPDVTPLKEGDVIDLGGETLKVINTPGHANDQISFLHQESGRLYVGDSLGLHLGENSYVPPFFPANWNLEAFQDTIEKLKQTDFKQLCFAHFGCISEEKSTEFLDFALEQTNLWWTIFEQADAVGKVRDYDYMTKKILKDSGLTIPNIELLSAKLRIGLKLLNGVRRIRGKKSLQAAQVLMHDYVIPWLSRGYRIYKENLERG